MKQTTIFDLETLNISPLPDDFFFKNIENKSNNMSMKQRLGFFPTSIWKPDIEITKYLKKIINDTCQTRQTLNANRSDRRNGVNNGKCSVFNPHLAQMVYSAYCPLNAKIYDPFGGGGTRGYIATQMGFDYTGVEIRKEECERIYKQMKQWGIEFKLINDDSMKYIPNEKYDFVFSCPPYYDLEVYSNDKNDLSNAETYDDFLDMLAKTLINCYNCLKKECFAVFVVGNFRNEKGELEHFNGDLVRIAKEIGFKLWDELIWEGASNVAITRCGKFEKNRKSVRMHEYIIILKKSGDNNE